MAKRKKSAATPPVIGGASAHGSLANNHVHVFVDDQNLFYGIVNDSGDYAYRLDFGELLTVVAKTSTGVLRGVKSAYIAGVVPDDDSFWRVADNQGFTVRRGYLGAGNRSKQDDAHLITDLVATLFEKEGPSTIVLVAGDADYVPPLAKALEKGWRTEVVFISRGLSESLTPVVHEFRTLRPEDVELSR
jgi:uncharacterized LabA/DUF88 family protein